MSVVYLIITGFLLKTFPLLPWLELDCYEKPADTVRIGLLVQDSQSVSAVHGAEMAVDEANLSGKYPGKYFSLEVRNMEGAWGKGAKQTVNLVFGEDVWAVIGSVDGRNSHLAEQVSAKTHVPYITAWSGDPTLAQAFIPWYFSCVPSDLQQADCILQFIMNSKGIPGILILSDNGYDSKMASSSFIKRAKKAGIVATVYYYANDLSAVVTEKVVKLDPDCIVIFGTGVPGIRLINDIRKTNINADIFCSRLFTGEKEFSGGGLKKLEGTSLVSPGYFFSTEGRNFITGFEKKFRFSPGPVAAYAYDAVNVVTEGIRRAGDDRTKLKDCIMDIQHEGLTGRISFDDNGNLDAKPFLMKIKDGEPELVR